MRFSTAREHAGQPVGIVLEVAEHLGEGDRPVLQLDVVLDGHAEHFGRHDGGQRFGEIGQQVHPSGRRGPGCRRSAAWRCPGCGRAARGRRRGHERRRRPASAGGCAPARRRKSICLTMTLAIGLTSGAPRASKYSGEGVRFGGKAGEDGDDVLVARDDPGVQVRIPMDRGLASAGGGKADRGWPAPRDRGDGRGSTGLRLHAGQAIGCASRCEARDFGRQGGDRRRIEQLPKGQLHAEQVLDPGDRVARRASSGRRS